MSRKEIKRIGIIQRVMEKKLKQVRAAEVLDLSDRQIRRLVGRYREEGEKGLVHRSRGKRSNRQYPEKLKQKVLKIYEKEVGATEKRVGGNMIIPNGDSGIARRIIQKERDRFEEVGVS